MSWCETQLPKATVHRAGNEAAVHPHSLICSSRSKYRASFSTCLAGILSSAGHANSIRITLRVDFENITMSGRCSDTQMNFGKTRRSWLKSTIISQSSALDNRCRLGGRPVAFLLLAFFTKLFEISGGRSGAILVEFCFARRSSSGDFSVSRTESCRQVYRPERSAVLHPARM